MKDLEKEVHSLYKEVRQNPKQNDEKLGTIISHIQDNPKIRGFAVARLESLADDYPEIVCTEADKLTNLFKSTDEVLIRTNFARLFKHLVESDICLDQPVMDGVKESVRLREQEYWADDPDREEGVIKYGIEAYSIICGEHNREIPESSFNSIEAVVAGGNASRRTVIETINLYKNLCTSNSEYNKKAFDRLIYISGVDNDNLSLRAMSALAELSMNGFVEDDEVLEVISSNYIERSQEVDLIEEFLQKHSN